MTWSGVDKSAINTPIANGTGRLKGLCFVNLEQIAKQPKMILALVNEKKPIGLELLQEQEEFFLYVRQCFGYLAQSYIDWDRRSYPLALKQPIRIDAKPPKKTQPLLHN
jgi:hypothetical protein